MKQPGQSFLVFARLCQEWSKGVIEAIMSMYQQRLFNIKGGIYIPELNDTDMTRVTTELCTFFATLSKASTF